MPPKTIVLAGILSLLAFPIISSHAAGSVGQTPIRETVDQTIRPLMRKYKIPGMAVAVTLGGRSAVYDYGVASRDTKRPVTNATLFEIGSLSKTFTATLAAYAQVKGALSFPDSASKDYPSLRGSSFDEIPLLDLGTHTSGGLPLQVPDQIKHTDQLMEYFKHWKPTYAAGTHRLYSNPSVGLLGMIAAKSLHEPFDDAVEKKLFPALGMTHSYINVPTDQIKNYAQGYTEQDAPIRMRAGVLASEAYGVKSNATDMIRFVDANMGLITLDRNWQRAIMDTHTGYFKAGQLTQDLVWEQYSYPVGLKRLLAGNAETMIYDATIAAKLTPPAPPQANVLIDKTGSTNGFSAYAAFIPAKNLGIVILANKNYPIAARVTAAYQILTRLDRPAAPGN